MNSDADWAFAQYERFRGVLPKAQSARSRAISHMREVADELDVLLLDAFGVLNIGHSVIAGAPEWVAGMQRAGKQVFVVTNHASVSADAALEKYRGLGFDLILDDVVSSRDALVAGLKNRKEKVWGVMAAPDAKLEELPVKMVFLADDLLTYDRVDGFVLLGSGCWNEERQNLLVKSVKNNPRPVMVGNPDIVAPREDRLSLEPGWFAHELQRQTGISPRFYGKPYANVFELALSRVKGEVKPNRIAMVGDTLHTDVLGGAAAGLKTVLVTGYGLFAGRNVTPFIEKSGIVPDWII